MYSKLTDPQTTLVGKCSDRFFLQMLNVKNFVSLDSALIFVLKVFLALLVDGAFLADVTWLVRVRLDSRLEIQKINYKL